MADFSFYWNSTLEYYQRLKQLLFNRILSLDGQLYELLLQNQYYRYAYICWIPFYFPFFFLSLKYLSHKFHIKCIKFNPINSMRAEILRFLNKIIIYKISSMENKIKNVHPEKSDSSEFLISLDGDPDHQDIGESRDIYKSTKGCWTQNKAGKKNHGNWGKDEEKRFLDHMIKYENIYRNKDLRRAHKIFKKMAKVVKSRTSEQCRSHHQKLDLKLKSYDAIIKALNIKFYGLPAQEQSDDGIHYSPINIQNFLPKVNDQKNHDQLDKPKVQNKKSSNLLCEQNSKVKNDLKGTQVGMNHFDKEKEMNQRWQMSFDEHRNYFTFKVNLGLIMDEY